MLIINPLWTSSSPKIPQDRLSARLWKKKIALIALEYCYQKRMDSLKKPNFRSSLAKTKLLKTSCT